MRLVEVFHTMFEVNVKTNQFEDLSKSKTKSKACSKQMLHRLLGHCCISNDAYAFVQLIVSEIICTVLHERKRVV